MRIPVMHGIVTLLAEADAVPWRVCHLRVMFNRIDVVNMLSFPEPPIPSALLTLVLIPAEYRLSKSFPSFSIVYHMALQKGDGSVSASRCEKGSSIGCFHSIIIAHFFCCLYVGKLFFPSMNHGFVLKVLQRLVLKMVYP